MTCNSRCGCNINEFKFKLEIINKMSSGELIIATKESDDKNEIYSAIINNYIPFNSKRKLIVICRVTNKTGNVHELELSNNSFDDKEKNFILDASDSKIKSWVDNNFNFEEWELY